MTKKIVARSQMMHTVRLKAPIISEDEDENENESISNTGVDNNSIKTKEWGILMTFQNCRSGAQQ
jgi:hypothetical protein